MNVEIPIEVQIVAQASSTFTMQNIDDRLSVLGSDPAHEEERAYLERLKRKLLGRNE